MYKLGGLRQTFFLNLYIRPMSEFLLDEHNVVFKAKFKNTPCNRKLLTCEYLPINTENIQKILTTSIY
jgi:hypothetical protein